MQTRITKLFGIQHPIIQGGMHFVGFAELAAAVSNAGGLGIITGLTQRTRDRLKAEIERCRGMTDKPFGVNLTFLPAITPPDYPGFIDVIVNNGVKVVETAGNNPQKYLPALKQAGIKVIHKCTSMRHALKAESIGCDAVSVDGFECGGHPGEHGVALDAAEAQYSIGNSMLDRVALGVKRGSGKIATMPGSGPMIFCRAP